MIEGIQEAVTIPVMAKARIGHFVEAQVLEALEIDYVDESEVLTPADEANHIDKWAFKVPFVCGATDLGEALRRIAEGAAMIRTKGEAGTGNVVEAVRHMRQIVRRHPPPDGARRDRARDRRQGPPGAARAGAQGRRERALPVVNFSAGGIATPADAALMMQLGAEGVFVGSGIFKSEDPEPRARARSSRRPRTSRTPSGSRMPRAGSAKRWPASRSARSPRTAGCCRTAAGVVVGVLAIQGDFEAHSKIVEGLGAEAREVRTPDAARGPRRTDHPGRRVDHDDARHRARGSRRAAA